ncbi:MAG TPA: hypothetical protein VFF52_24740 [Isosphaeraceae bacterium]|nr:hypothetical protein [Isosphaeraceae bacterium]
MPFPRTVLATQPGSGYTRPVAAVAPLSPPASTATHGRPRGDRLDDRPHQVRGRLDRGSRTEQRRAHRRREQRAGPPWLARQQVRYLTVTPNKKDSIASIELVKGRDQTAPIVLAATVEGFE